MINTQMALDLDLLESKHDVVSNSDLVIPPSVLN